jgi:hypothetical protein
MLCCAVLCVQVTNPRWSAPEVLRNSVVSLSADVFSFAVVMWELLTWAQPYEEMMSVQVGRYSHAGTQHPIAVPLCTIRVLHQQCMLHNVLACPACHKVHQH